ncbi:MAG: hypothetical protein QOH23_973 [Gaiellaceae bacterium]|nr:hypothetical protein [Gaiellaceae bacterium]
MESEAISRDIEALERELSGLRARVEGDSSAFADLERQVAGLRERLLETRESVTEREARLAEKQRELAEARRLEGLEAYKDNLSSQREAGNEAAAAAVNFLAAVEAYDDATLDLRRLLEEMRTAFGTDERVAEVESALEEEPTRLLGTWEAVMGATKWRLDTLAVNGDTPRSGLPEDLQDLAQERRRSLIKDYFGKS